MKNKIFLTNFCFYFSPESSGFSPPAGRLIFGLIYDNGKNFACQSCFFKKKVKKDKFLLEEFHYIPKSDQNHQADEKSKAGGMKKLFYLLAYWASSYFFN